MKLGLPLLAALALLLWLVGCQAGNTPREPAGAHTSLAVEREYTGALGPFPDRGYFVVQRPEVWESLWHHQSAPEVDFAHHSVLVALMGQQPTSGYCTQITAVRPCGHAYTAYVAESRPARDSLTTHGTTYPFSMVVVPKLTGPVRFVLTNAPLTAPTPYPIADGFQGLNSVASKASTTVLHTAVAWSHFWMVHFARGVVPPKVDFARYVAVAVFAGQQATGGYTVSIPLVQRDRTHLTVNYRMFRPCAGQSVGQGSNSPYAIAIIPRADLPIVFHAMGTSELPGMK